MIAFFFSISWDSTDEEIDQFDHSNEEESTVASRTRSHTPPHHINDKKQVKYFSLISLKFQ